MPTLMIKRLQTGQPICTGIETDEVSFKKLPDVLAHTRCPVCGLEHAWWAREAWLADGRPPKSSQAPDGVFFADQQTSETRVDPPDHPR
jgi:hypothetical protein